MNGNLEIFICKKRVPADDSGVYFDRGEYVPFEKTDDGKFRGVNTKNQPRELSKTEMNRHFYFEAPLDKLSMLDTILLHLKRDETEIPIRLIMTLKRYFRLCSKNS